MATEELLTANLHSFPANADLSASQYCFVTLNSSGNVAVTGASGDAIGVLQNKPAAAGRAAAVAIGGRTKMLLGGTVAKGAQVVSDSTGRAVTAISGELILGICVEGGTVGLIGSIIFDRASNPA